MKIILTTLNGERIVTTEDKNYRAQYLRVEEAFADGLTLQQAVDEFDGFCDDWVPVDDKIGWGATIETAEAPHINLINENDNL